VATGEALDLLPWPRVDFEQYGAVRRVRRTRVHKIVAANLHRNWVRIPHVTNHDDADIEAVEALRQQLNRDLKPNGERLTLMPFLIKAAARSLAAFPQFNASLEGDSLVVKEYCHIGFAVDTPHGLMVPVVRDVSLKDVLALGRECAALTERARAGRLAPDEMAGGSFSISSLGGIGGRYFTPIINAPEVAILGVCTATLQPWWQGNAFEPRLTLPLSLSWDHRAVDGAAAARFLVELRRTLADGAPDGWLKA
jgi:pyruvate dehydrogenase E2 component (dihydrolipoamide acetyltransferase)